MEYFLPIAQVEINIAFIFILSLFVGVLSGLFGVGGGFLMTPFLIFLGIPPAYAVPNEASNILGTSVSGSTTHYLKGTLDYKMGFMIVIGGIFGTLLGILTFSYLKANYHYNETNNAQEVFLKILDDEISNKMPLDIIEKAKKNFNERIQNLNWESYYNDLPFNPSALSLYKWAPIAEDLKTLDRKIVLNSVILKWDIVKKEFNERINF